MTMYLPAHVSEPLSMFPSLSLSVSLSLSLSLSRARCGGMPQARPAAQSQRSIVGWNQLPKPLAAAAVESTFRLPIALSSSVH